MNSAKTKIKLQRGRAACDERGFTILETVIALFITMVVGLGAISLFLFSISFNAGASDRARALALAQQRIEVLRTASYDTLNSTLATTNTGAVNVGSTTAGESDSRTFNVTTTITDDPNVSSSRLKIITVTVSPANAGRWSGGSVTLRLLRASIARP